MSCSSYTNGKRNTKFTEHPRLEFRSENEFQDKLAENELIIKESENESQERVPLSQLSRCSRKVHRRPCQNTVASTQTSLTPTGRSSIVQQTFLVSKNTGPTPMEVGALVKAQVTKDEEAKDGGNDKGKSPGKNGGKDKKGNKGVSKGRITFATWIKSCIRWVGSATTGEYCQKLKDCWHGNKKGQPCYRLNTIDGNMSQSSSGQDQSAETTTYNSPQNRRMGHISNLTGGRTVD